MTVAGSEKEVADRVRVVHFQRRAERGAFSVERMFDDIRAGLPGDIQLTVRMNKFLSRGVVRRLFDIVRARWLSGSVNHVLGDVHYLTLLLPRARTMLTVLDCVSLQRLTGIKRYLLWLFWYRLPLRRVACVTVISPFTRDALVELTGYPKQRIRVIPPPLSPHFTYSPKSKPEQAEPSRVLLVGTTGNKNLLRSMDAMAGLAVVLVIVGDLGGTERMRLDELGLAFENHRDLSSEQLLEQYRRADVVLFASTYEGFGLPIVEAQAVGRPVVTSNLGAMPDTAGGAACLVDPFDVGDIRRGVKAVLEDPAWAAELVQRGRENANRFAVNRIAAQYAELYRELNLAQVRWVSAC